MTAGTHSIPAQGTARDSSVLKILEHEATTRAVRRNTQAWSRFDCTDAGNSWKILIHVIVTVARLGARRSVKRRRTLTDDALQDTRTEDKYFTLPDRYPAVHSTSWRGV